MKCVCCASGLHSLCPVCADADALLRLGEARRCLGETVIRLMTKNYLNFYMCDVCFPRNRLKHLYGKHFIFYYHIQHSISICCSFSFFLSFRYVNTNNMYVSKVYSNIINLQKKMLKMNCFHINIIRIFMYNVTFFLIFNINILNIPHHVYLSYFCPKPKDNKIFLIFVYINLIVSQQHHHRYQCAPPPPMVMLKFWGERVGPKQTHTRSSHSVWAYSKTTGVDTDTTHSRAHLMYFSCNLWLENNF